MKEISSQQEILLKAIEEHNQGATVKEVTEKYGFSASTFYKNAAKLRKENNQEESPQFDEVKIEDTCPIDAGANNPTITVKKNDIEILVSEQTDLRLLKKVLVLINDL